MGISERIKIIRTKEALKQDEFASMLGITRDWITKVETGYRPSEQLILNICRTFHINIEWLKEGQGEMYREGSSDIKNSRIVNHLNGKIAPKYRSLFFDIFINLSDIGKDKLNSIIPYLKIFADVYKSDDKKKIKALTALLELIKE